MEGSLGSGAGGCFKKLYRNCDKNAEVAKA